MLAGPSRREGVRFRWNVLLRDFTLVIDVHHVDLRKIIFLRRSATAVPRKCGRRPDRAPRSRAYNLTPRQTTGAQARATENRHELRQPSTGARTRQDDRRLRGE